MNKTTIAIMKEEVPFQFESIPIDVLRFLPDNPRVYAATREMPDFEHLTPDEKQARIYERLLQEPSVEKLIPEIERDGGLEEPIIVRIDTRQVIEGNSRLAAYRMIREKRPNEDKWVRINCHVVKSLTEAQQTRLLGQTHLAGKTEWSPHAKALFCFRWVEDQRRSITELAELLGCTPLEIKKDVRTIKLMQENDDKIISNFSYYRVLVRGRKISPEIENNESLRNRLLSQIKTGRFTDDDGVFTAQKMRDRLPTIIAKPKILKKYSEGTLDLEDAYENARVSGVEQRLKKIHSSLDEIERNDIEILERNEVNAIKQVVRKIGQRLARVSKIVDDQLS